MTVLTTKQIGDGGEDLAVAILEDSGYEIVKRNYRNRYGEVDIIAKDGDVLVFVEVKKKSGNNFGNAGDMITSRKKFKLKNMAESYVQEIEFSGEYRIDAFLIDGFKTEIIKNIE